VRTLRRSAFEPPPDRSRRRHEEREQEEPARGEATGRRPAGRLGGGGGACVRWGADGAGPVIDGCGGRGRLPFDFPCLGPPRLGGRRPFNSVSRWARQRAAMSSGASSWGSNECRQRTEKRSGLKRQ